MTTLALALGTVLLAQSAKPSELDVIKARFESAGWQTQVRETAQHKVLVVLSENLAHYMFRFEKWPDGLRGYPVRDPNTFSLRYVGGEAQKLYFETPDWPQMQKIAAEFSFEDFELRVFAADAKVQFATKLLLHSETIRPLTATESKQLLNAIRASKLVEREVTDRKGTRIVNLPRDTKVSQAYISGDLVWADLHSSSNPLHTKYSFVARMTPLGIRPVFTHADDIHYLPFDPAFPTMVKMHSAIKGLTPWWNYYEDGQGQVGLWHREQLRTPSRFEAWSPTEQEAIAEKLWTTSKSLRGLAYARCGISAICQFYDSEGNLTYAEFKNGNLVKTRNLLEAIDHLKATKDRDLWQCYNGVSQQFGHYYILQTLYKTRSMAKA